MNLHIPVLKDLRKLEYATANRQPIFFTKLTF